MISQECLERFALIKEGVNPAWHLSVGHFVKVYLRDAFQIAVPFAERHRRAKKKVDGEALFNTVHIKDIVEDVKEKHALAIGTSLDLATYGGEERRRERDERTKNENCPKILSAWS